MVLSLKLIGVNVFSLTRIGLTAQANFNVQIYDYLMTTTEEQTNNYTEDDALRDQTATYRSELNESLTLELLDSSGNVLDRSLPTDNKETKQVNFQILNFLI